MKKLRQITWILLIVGLASGVAAPALAQKKGSDKAELDKLRTEVAKLRADLDAALREINALKAAMGDKTPADQGPLYRGRSARSWLDQLKDVEPKARIDALEALGALARTDKKLIPVLIDTAKSDSGQVPGYAVKALGVAGAESLPALIDMAKDDKQLRYEAVQAIGSMGPKGKPAVPVLAKILSEESHVGMLLTTNRALYGIGLDAKEAIPSLVKALGKCLEDIGKPEIGGTSPIRFGVRPNSVNVRIMETLKVLDPALAAEVPLPNILDDFKRARSASTQAEQEEWRALHATLVKRYAKPK